MEMQRRLHRPFPAGGRVLPYIEPLFEVSGDRLLAQALADNTGKPIVVLDEHLIVVAASISFYGLIGLTRQYVQDCPFFALGDGRWNLAEIRLLLEQVALPQAPVQACEVEQDFPGIGRRLLLLTARRVSCNGNLRSMILLGIEDLTERRAKERDLAKLLQRKDTSLQEMQHRIANSLQIIASTLLVTSRTGCSDETRQYLLDAHHRIMSVAILHQQLQVSGTGAIVELGPYLSRLCGTLAVSLIGDRRPISLRVRAGQGTVSSSDAATFGLAVTELVINALKHAFPGNGSGIVNVTYDGVGTNWKLDVSDNGIGASDGGLIKPHQGLGTSILKALALQLDARLSVSTNSPGTTVSLIHAPLVPAFFPRGRAQVWHPSSLPPSIRKIMPSQPRETATCRSL